MKELGIRKCEVILRRIDVTSYRNKSQQIMRTLNTRSQTNASTAQRITQSLGKNHLILVLNLLNFFVHI